jgi:hypothetical protein
MKYDLGEEVRVKDTDKIGIVKSYRIDGYKLGGKKREVIQYGLSMGNLYSDFYKEDDLELYNTPCEFDDEFERGLCDLLIDIYLLHKEIDLVKKLFKEKRLYLDS